MDFVSLNKLSYFWSKISTILNGKQDVLVSGTNIKTVNNENILGNGNLNVSADLSSLATVATTGSYNDLSNKPTIPSAANDGTLTIQRNGSTIATFTANQSGNTIANIQCATTNTAAGINPSSVLLNSSAAKTVTWTATADCIMIAYIYEWEGTISVNNINLAAANNTNASCVFCIPMKKGDTFRASSSSNYNVSSFKAFGLKL